MSDPINAVDWTGSTFALKNLGPRKIEEKLFAKTSDYPRGLAFQANGDLLATIGSGTTADRRIEKWSGPTQSTYGRFQWHNYTASDFKDPEKMKDRIEGETQGVFWFFGGPLAVDGKDQIYFNLGACGPNGLYQLLHINPIKVEMLFSSGGFGSLQFFPTNSEDLYATSFGGIEKFDPATAKNADEGVSMFSMVGGSAHLINALLIDQDHILATLAVNRLSPGDEPVKKRLPSELVAVAFDRKLQGYYSMPFKNWGPMAVRPSDGAFFRFDPDAKEIRQFTLPFLGVAKSSQSQPNQPISAPASANQPEADASVILSQARDAYAALTSYSDSGTMGTRMGSFSQKGTFTIRMQRPSLYRITWAGIGAGGVAWSDGTGDYLRSGGIAHEKQKDRQTALAGATGISAGVASTIPACFFEEQWGAVLNEAGDYHLEADESIDNTQCSVITSTLHTQGATINRRLWIAHIDHLIRQVEETTSGAPTIPTITDAAAKTMLQQENKSVTPDAVSALRLQLTNAQEMARRMMQNGGVFFTQTHRDIRINQPLAAANLQPDK